ncbi:MAG TPA: DUF883 C-terminal domain-containing protein [Methylophilaceae bacterium]|nr:DUF883 C-terminal domain-containing protein [Methylophilaceae bacterium]
METTQNTTGIPGSGKSANLNQAASGIHDKIDAARPAVERAMDSAHEKVDHLADMASQASETFEQKAAEFKEMQAKFMENATSYVQAHPMASMGIAIAAGFLLSKMMSSSSSHSHHESGL